jgi:hypothetical protein
MFRKFPFSLWVFLLIFLMYNGYAYYLGQQVEVGNQKQMLTYWAWIDLGSRLNLFMIGISGVAWAIQKHRIPFFTYASATTLSFYLLQIIVSLCLFPEVQKPLIANNPTIGWSETIMGWGDVKATTLILMNSAWTVCGLIIGWLAYYIQCKSAKRKGSF